MFIASDYSILGRLASHIGATDCLAIPARRITTVFVVSDIATFLIQVSFPPKPHAFSNLTLNTLRCIGSWWFNFGRC